jgi:uncharacterized protein YdeI (YjbR/CyaY-like superfamily)
MKPTFFKNQSEFRKWLEKNHNKKTELMVGFYRVDSGKKSITWSQSVDEALCFGWIDGIRKPIDKDSYCIRFTPRKSKSNWSAVNIKKVEVLTKQGLMNSAGLASFENKKENKSEIYSYENKPEKLPDELERKFQTNKKAWEFFKRQSPSYQKTVFYWIMSAKQEATRVKRLERLIKESETEKKLF